MINDVNLIGVVLRVNIPERYKDDERYSPVLIIQYGPQREMRRGQAVHFVNAVPVKIIAPKWQMVKDQIKEGALVQIQGHLQGLVREEDDYRKPGVEVVVDRINTVMMREVTVLDSFTGSRVTSPLPVIQNVGRIARERRERESSAADADAATASEE